MSQINFAHLRDRSTSGGDINFVVFEADTNNKTDSARRHLLAQLTAKVSNNLRVDKSALAFVEHGRITYFGTPDLVEYLSKRRVPNWTHTLNI